MAAPVCIPSNSAQGSLFSTSSQANQSNERGEVTTDITEIQRIVIQCYEKLYGNKVNVLGEMDKFLEMYNLPKPNQEESENLNRVITTNVIEAVIKKTQQQKS